MKLAENLLIQCRKKGITLATLARKAGVPQATLHGWSTGRSVQNLDDLKKICSVLEISLHQILFGLPDPNEKGQGSFIKGDVYQLKVCILSIEEEK